MNSVLEAHGLIGGGGAITPPEPSPYVRPADWLPLPVLTDADHRFVGLHAIYENANFVALSASGDYTVDWGDGVVENFASGAVAEHEYNYTIYDPGNTTLCSRGYKQAIVSVTPQAGQVFSTLDLHRRHTAISIAHSSGFLDIAIAGSAVTSLYISKASAQIGFFDLERVTLHKNSVTNFAYMFANCFSLQSIPLLDTSMGTDFSFMFNNCYSLQSIPLLNTSAGNNFSNMFNGCYSLQNIPLLDTSAGADFYFMFGNCPSLQSIPLLNTSAGTNFSYMFGGCFSLQSIPLLNTSKGTNFSNMFSSCYSLQSIPLLNTSAGTNFGGMFNGSSSLKSIPLLDTSAGTGFYNMFSNCFSLQSIPLLNTSQGTNFSSMFSSCFSLQSIPLLNTSKGTNFSNMFSSCFSLQSVPLLDTSTGASFSVMFNGCRSLSDIGIQGTKENLSVASCKLSAEALNKLYTNLGTSTGKNLMISGNYGAAASNRSIATAKGWTITG